MGEQSKSSNLEFSGVCHCGALSGEVFRFQSMSSTCIIMLVEKQHNLILMKWDSYPDRISNSIHWISHSSFVNCEENEW